MSEKLKQSDNGLKALGRADRYLDEILENIHHIDLFDDFNESEVKMVCQYMRCYAAPRDYPLLQEGMNGDYLVLVLTGAVEERRRLIGDGEQIVTEITAGTTLGEVSIIDGKAHQSTWVATKPTDFAVLSREALNALLVEAPRLGNKLLLTLLQLISSKLRDASRQLGLVPSLA